MEQYRAELMKSSTVLPRKTRELINEIIAQKSSQLCGLLTSQNLWHVQYGFMGNCFKFKLNFNFKTDVTLMVLIYFFFRNEIKVISNGY